jgi:VWFA-related protein
MKFRGMPLGRSLPAVILIVFAAGAYCLPVRESSQSPDEFTISATVERVILPVSVLDRKGRFVPELKQNDFRVYENGRPREIKFFSDIDLPVTVGLVVDNSGSMRSKRPETNLAALDFVRLSNPEDEIFVVNFNEEVSLGLPDGIAFSSDPHQLGQALAVRRPEGMTALYDAIMTGLERLQKGTRHKKALIVISDGGDNASNLRFQDVLRQAQRSNATIYTIGIFDPDDPDRNPGLLKRLARATGGEAFLPERASKIFDATRQIATDLRNQYTIGYAPGDRRHDGSYRRIQVVVNVPALGKLTVRTRPGYLAPGPDQDPAN